MAGFGDGYVGTATDALKIRRYQKKREDALKDMETRKKKSEENALNAGLKRFDAGRGDKIEAAFKQETVGLMTRDQYISTKSTIEAKLDELERKKRKDKEEEEVRVLEQKRKKHREKTAKLTSKLSFDIEEEDDEGIEIIPKKKKTAESDHEGESGKGHSNGSNYIPNYSSIGKCPEVDTSFLPDRVREQREIELREELKREWIKRQEEIKNENLEVVYSYWDGAGHRRKLKVRKGDTIGSFLELVRKQLEPDFRELKLLPTEKLLYVKEDLIIPHHYSFYELIVNKARGKSGPLFYFDVHEDVRMEGDHRVEKDESHAGKVVERYWYEKNRHIFPANRWEVYDPTKNRNDKYTVHDWNKGKS